MNKYKIIALCGESGVGKDYLLREIIYQDKENFIPKLNKIINCTTRPPREDEQDGINYFYLSVPEFTDKVFNGNMIETTKFRDWFYGTSLDSLDNKRVNIGIFNPASLKILAADSRLELYIFKLEASPKTRLIRSLKRESNPDVDEIIRRYQADKIDFLEMDIDYTSLANETTEDFYHNVTTILKCTDSLGKFD